MPIWDEIQYKKTMLSVAFGKGINTYNDPLDLANDELTDSLNMCADDFPIIRTRNDRTRITLPETTQAIWGIGARGNSQIHVLNGNTWQYGVSTGTAWTELTTEITAGAYASFVEFNTQSTKFTILAYSTGVVYNSYWDGTAVSTFADANAPRSNLYTAHRYRVYGIENDKRTLKYSAQGAITDWTTAGDAGYIDITNANGPVTAITTYADHPIIWTDNSMHELYGTGPDNYELVNISHRIGCVTQFAFCECDNKLFWLDYNGIYVYTGGLPSQIAYKASGLIEGINWVYKHLIRAGSVGDKAYFAIPYKSTANNRIIVIDVIEGKGQPTHTINLEDGNWVGYVNNNEALFGIENNGFIYNMHSTRKEGVDGSTTVGSTAISWSMETKPITDELIVESAVRDIWIQHSGTTDATMELGFTTNSNSTTYTQMAATTDFTHVDFAIRKQLFPTSTQLQGMPFMKFQFKGTGHKKISGFQINLISYGGIK
jgi:hypothetical protein